MRLAVAFSSKQHNMFRTQTYKTNTRNVFLISIYVQWSMYVKYFLTDPTDPGPTLYQPTRKRFKPSKEDILCADQAENVAMAKAYERAVQFKTSLKAIIAWHDKQTI